MITRRESPSDAATVTTTTASVDSSAPSSGEGSPPPAVARGASERTKALGAMLRERSFQRKEAGGPRDAHKLTSAEERETGVVALSVWKRFAAFLGPWLVLAILCAMLLAQLTNFAESLWLAKWAEGAYGDGRDKVWLYAGPYAALTALILVFNAVRTTTLYWTCLIASRKIHSRTLRGVLDSPMAFFDTTPLGAAPVARQRTRTCRLAHHAHVHSHTCLPTLRLLLHQLLSATGSASRAGRVLNRFSKELQTVDQAIGMPASNVLRFGFRLASSITLIVYGTSPYLLLIFVLLLPTW